MLLCSEIFQGGQDGYTPSEDVNSPTCLPGSQRIDNPGTLPMRPDEPGTPLVVSGRVLDGNGKPNATGLRTAVRDAPVRRRPPGAAAPLPPVRSETSPRRAG